MTITIFPNPKEGKLNISLKEHYHSPWYNLKIKSKIEKLRAEKKANEQSESSYTEALLEEILGMMPSDEVIRILDMMANSIKNIEELLKEEAKNNKHKDVIITADK